MIYIAPPPPPSLYLSVSLSICLSVSLSLLFPSSRNSTTSFVLHNIFETVIFYKYLWVKLFLISLLISVRDSTSFRNDKTSISKSVPSLAISRNLLNVSNKISTCQIVSYKHRRVIYPAITLYHCSSISRYLSR